jgi:hypothetical protein
MGVVSTQIVETGQPLLFFTYNGSFWMLVADSFHGTCEMWSSPDGLTWTQQGASLPFYAGILPAACYDGAQTVTIWYQPGSPANVTDLQQFNLSTGTWGAKFASQGTLIGGYSLPAYIAPYGAGQFIVLYQTTQFISLNQSVYAQIWDGTSWGAGIHVSAGAEALSGFNAQVFFNSFTGVLDANNVLHVIFNSNIRLGGPATWKNRFFYQEVSAAGALQNFQEFPGQSGASQDLWPMNNQPGAMMFIQGSSIYWGIMRYNYGTNPNPYPSIYVGTPLVNPVWTELGNIDPANANVPAGYFPIFQLNGGQLYANWVSNAATQVRAAISSNGFASITNTTLIDNTADGLPNLFNTGAFIVFGSTFSYATGAIITEGGIPVFWTGFIGSPIKITFRGVRLVRCDSGKAPALGEAENAPELPHVKRAM